ncbi:MAG: hypothetical protein KatS3mg051_1946 [Anaerolineae bacterium]|nr:MAG: hypothetical protein KatS3mg051_1946 [Anaerolineae bacterium]
MAGGDLFALEIGDVVEITETQTALTDEKYWIIGISYELEGEAVQNVTFTLAPLGDKTYLTLDDPVYGLLDQNYLAL